MKHVLQHYVVNKLRNYLTNKGISQKQLSDELLLSRQMIFNYLTEKTDLTLNTFEEICGVLNILPGEILWNYPLIESGWGNGWGNGNTKTGPAGARCNS